MLHRKQCFGTRDGTVAKSIDFISHSVISPHRERAIGGTFPTTEVSKTQKRLGIGETGHGKISLVADFVEKLHDPHFKLCYEGDLSAYPKAYHLRGGDFDKFNRSLPITKPLIRSNFFYTQSRFVGYAGKPTHE